MVKVITYGTYDHLHQGHINLLKRAKALGDYLLVGVTTENFDISRGKINVEQSLMERIEAVKALGIADEVFPEEYVGQKIDDIKKYNVDIFTVGSDWKGYFDYLNDYCKVVYLPRTKGVSSTQIRDNNTLKMGAIGTDSTIKKMKYNSSFVNGLEFGNVYFDETPFYDFDGFNFVNNLDSLFESNDIIYVATRPEKRYEFVKLALNRGKHVICESPISLYENQTKELLDLANEKKLVLFDSIKTAFMLSFSRMALLVKSGLIGDVKAIDVTCTSLEVNDWIEKTHFYTSFTDWGSIALLPVFKLLGSDYKKINYLSFDSGNLENTYSKINIEYDNACATLSLGVGVKSESDLRISGTKGYIYVKAPWWKSEYFEARYENSANNLPYYFQSEGEGIRMELVHLVGCIKHNNKNFYVERGISESISKVFEKCYLKKI